MQSEDLKLWESFQADPTNVEKRNQLVDRYMPLVCYHAHRMHGNLSQVDVDVLIQAGFIGLADAINSFELGRGTVFATYSAMRIRGAMLDEVRNSDWVPRLVRRWATKLRKVIEQVRSNGPATEETVKAALGMDDHEFEQLKAAASVIDVSSMSQATLFETDSGRRQTISDVIQSKDSTPSAGLQRKDVLRLVTKGLSVPERVVVIGYYYEGKTMKEIGKELGLSESRVSQMHSTILPRIKERMKNRKDEFVP